MAGTITNQAHAPSGLVIDNQLYHERYDDPRTALPPPPAAAIDACGADAEQALGCAIGGQPIDPANSHIQVAAVAADLPSDPCCVTHSAQAESPASEGARPAFAAGVGSHSPSGPTAAGALISPTTVPSAVMNETVATPLAQQLIAQLVAAVSETKQVGSQLLVPPTREDAPLPNAERAYTTSAKLDDEAKLPDKYHDRDNPLVASATSTSSEAATLLDGVWDETQGPFEGPEKLLELWFADSSEALALPRSEPSHRGLKAVPRAMWEQMLDLVHCKVLSVISSAEVDAYLLSESSMFVFPHKLILKTCGTTTLLLGLERLLEIAAAALAPHFVAIKMHTPLSIAELAGGNALTETYASEEPSMLGPEKGEPVVDLHKLALGRLVQRCFYSRKSFMFPERQKGPHKGWTTEVATLGSFFGPLGGAAYTVGKMNGDHWMLYTSQPESSASDEKVRAELETTPAGQALGPADQTLEMLMTHLGPQACRHFFYDEDTSLPTGGDEADRGHALGSKTVHKLGLDTLYADTQLDAYAFDPCGFSANAVVPRPCAQRGLSCDGYWTIHVTPEEDFSYASFETNVVPSCGASSAGGTDSPLDTKALIQRVVEAFEPGRMTITLFASADLDGGQGDVLQRLQLEGYRRTDRILYEFCQYDLFFVQFERVAA